MVRVWAFLLLTLSLAALSDRVFEPPRRAVPDDPWINARQQAQSQGFRVESVRLPEQDRLCVEGPEGLVKPGLSFERIEGETPSGAEQTRAVGVLLDHWMAQSEPRVDCLLAFRLWSWPPSCGYFVERRRRYGSYLFHGSNPKFMPCTQSQ